MGSIQTKESPFTPGRPVPVEYFIARRKEIERLNRAIKQTAAGRNENIFITGERGIGKSSLAGLSRYIAEKENGFFCAHCFLSGVKNLEEFTRIVFHRFIEDCGDKSVFEKLKGLFNRYIKGVTLFGVGVEFTEDKTDLRGLRDNFLPVLRKIYEQVKEAGRRGLMLILDDLNGITDLPEFSQFLKSFVDSIATSNKPLPILLVLVGVPERRADILKHQPSAGRIFDVVELNLMTEDESKEFFTSVFGKQMIKVDEAAAMLMVKLSGGYPMLMHEVGDAVFWQDTDGFVDLSDARRGITEAARIVGRKYIGPQVSSVFRSPVYSSILRRIGKKSPIGTKFTRQELLKDGAPEKERKNLDNFLNKIKKLGIMEDAEIRGEYKFVNPLYHLYLWYEAERIKESGKAEL